MANRGRKVYEFYFGLRFKSGNDVKCMISYVCAYTLISVASSVLPAVCEQGNTNCNKLIQYFPQTSSVLVLTRFEKYEICRFVVWRERFVL